MLEKQHWVVVADGRLDKPLGVVGACRADNFQPRRVRKVSFRILRVKWASVDAASRGPAQHHRNRRAPAEMRLGQHVRDLIEGATDEVHELEFGHRPHAGESGAEAGVHDGHLRDGCVHHALGAKTIDQPFRNFERAAVNTDVFADAEDRGIALHLFPDALANGFKIGDGCHE